MWVLTTDDRRAIYNLSGDEARGGAALVERLPLAATWSAEYRQARGSLVVLRSEGLQSQPVDYVRRGSEQFETGSGLLPRH